MRTLRIRSTALVIALSLILQLLVNRSLASADTWPQSLGIMPTAQLTTMTNGSVIASACAAATRFRQYRPDGTVAGASDDPTRQFCSQRMVATDNRGRMYHIYGDRITAFNGSTKLWEVQPTIPRDCWEGDQSSDITPESSSIGADGYLYITTTAYQSCYHIAKLNTATGATVFTRRMSTEQDGIPGSLISYNQGVMFVNFKGITYVTYSGQVQYVPIGVSSSTRFMPSDVNGNVYVITLTTRDSTDECSTNYVSGRLLGFNRSGQILDAPVPDCLSYPEDMVVTSDGRIVTVAKKNDQTLQLITMDRSGRQLYVQPFERLVGEVSEISDQLIADTKGQVLLARNIAYRSLSESGYKTVFRLLNPASGRILSAYTTPLSSLPQSRMAYDYANRPGIGMIRGALYYLLQRCGNENCAYEETVLYKGGMSQLGGEYPRFAVQGVAVTSPGLEYVALGDSYASGEGLPPFIGQSDANQCHRSSNAYAMLAEKSSAHLRLKAFVACSGATTWDVLHGRNGEAGQLDVLSPETDVVTITVGGDDVEFGKAARICNFDHGTDQCVAQLQRSRDISSSHEFRVKVANVVLEIKARAPHARVMTVGYPYIFSNPGAPSGCGWYAQLMSPQERELVEDITQDIDFALSLAASSTNSEFVDPRDDFASHLVCDNNNYTQGVNLFNNEYSYHPTLGGQKEYADEIVALIQR